MQKKLWLTEECNESGSAFSIEITKKLDEIKSSYQTICIYESIKFGNIMTIDGFLMLTQYDNFLYHEMMSHTAILSHTNPKNVLIIGGGDCGTLLEVAKHKNIETITQVEIDKEVTNLSTKYFPELCASNNDPRVKLVFEDAINWIKNIDKGALDIIIVDSTDPIGPAEGLFNSEFYSYCNRALADDGILVHQSESPLYHKPLISQIHVEMKKAKFISTNLFTFPQPSYPSGWWSATLATKTTFNEAPNIIDPTILTKY